MSNAEEKFEIEFGVALLSSLEGDRAFLNTLVSRMERAMENLRGFSKSRAFTMHRLAMDSAQSYTAVIKTILDEVEPRLKELEEEGQ